MRMGILKSVMVGVALSAIVNAGVESASWSAEKAPRVIYPKKTELDFEGAAIEGEIRNPGSFISSAALRRSSIHW